MTPLKDLSASQFPNGGGIEVLLRQLIPTINTIHDALRELESRIVEIEDGRVGCPCEEVEALHNEVEALHTKIARQATTVMPPRLEDSGLSDAVLRRLRDGGILTAAQVIATSNKNLLTIEGIGESRLDSIRDVYPRRD